MPKYSYIAKDSQGKEFRGIIESSDKDQAKVKLNQLGLYDVFLQDIAKAPRFKFSLPLLLPQKVDLALFAHQFSAMIAAGLPLVKCLSVLSRDTEDKILKETIDKVIFDIQNGLNLSSALAKHPKIFSNFFVSLIKAGETAGILPEVLKRIAIHLEKEADIKHKVASAMSYPVIVGFVAVGVVGFLVIFIIPVFKNVYKGLRVNLPLPTLFLIYISNFMIKYWWLLLLLIIAIFYAFKRLKAKNERVSFFLDYFKLWMPIFGKLNRKIYTTRFIRTLSAMLSSGVTLGRSLEITEEVLDNRVSSSVIRALQKNINQGKSLTEVLEKQKLFSPLAVQMIATGEQSGTLEEMLNKTADFLDEDIDHAIKRMMVKLEPALTFAMAILVGYIALAIYLPMFDIFRNLGGR
jgi:type IV pilus assembly protein PilC